MCPSIQDLKNILCSDDIQVISFDLFDTLITRPCSPRDVLRLCAEECNMSLEKYQQLRGWNGGWWSQGENCGEKLLLSNEQRLGLRKKEFFTELNLLTPRKCMKEVYNYAIKTGKMVIITTDMYMDIHMIQEILSKNGYEMYYAIYLSDENYRKKDGTMYEKIKEDFSSMGIDSKNIIHLGDNYQVDFINAQAHGIDSIHIPATYDLFTNSCLGKTIEPITLGDSVLFHTLANMLFDDPFTSYDGLSNGLIRNIGWVLGALFTSFTSNLIRDLRERNISKLLLIMRDGDILEHILPYFDSSGIEIKELQLNRLIRAPTILLKDGLFKNMMTGTEYYLSPECFSNEKRKKALSIVDSCRKTGNVSEKSIIEINGYLDVDYCTRQHTILKEYLENQFGIDQRIGLFDVGYNATAIKFLSNYFQFERYFHEYQLIGTTSYPNTTNFITQDKVRKYIPMDSIVKGIHKYKSIKKEGTQFIFECSQLEKINVFTEYVQLCIVEFIETIYQVIGKRLNKLVFTDAPYKIIQDLFKSDNKKDLEVAALFDKSIIGDAELPFALNKFEMAKELNKGLYEVCISRLLGNPLSKYYEKDLSLAHLRESVKYGVDVSRNELFDILWNANDPEKDCELLSIIQPLADKKDSNAIGRLGKMYVYGRGIEQNIKKGRELLEFASNQGLKWADKELKKSL